MTMPTTSRPRTSPVTSSTAWPDRAGRGQGRAGVPERGRTGGGEVARRGADRSNSVGAEFVFELADLGADAGLADVHPFGRAGEVGLLGDRDEVLQLPQFHNHRF